MPAETEVVAALRAAGCVFAEDEARLLLADATDEAHLAEMIRRRVAGEPLEHVLGWVEFCGLRIAVDPGVFVPRRRTQLLASEAAALASRAGAGAVVLDLCCGCGAVGVAVAAAVEGIVLHAADLDPVAVACARRNVETIGGQVHEGDLYAALPSSLRGRIDVLVVNAPYVPTEAITTMPPEARLHEATMALDGGSDGLDVLRRVIADAPLWLAPGGSVLFEAGTAQVAGADRAVTSAGLVPRVVRSAEHDATVVIGMAGIGSAGTRTVGLSPRG